ncbi:sensor histidine kinase [Candidatus Magnetominusculus xianensis]|uniref:histidine kinase n=1 Tax=Candidatus Magnetominusculus xianensis TaxID=1748249 RepID=A0ABR5SJ72_9BACT|nr:HAMP domain-containing sensor histidine kinase [Candidatus Magnetominusculus xianensis]KWT85580.1 histidine kinase [Candidatus Magnetominusculus xianensis]MBF0404189.1 HAMP domain-containing histidine kinase [Nitrospirota bacterium]
MESNNRADNKEGSLDFSVVLASSVHDMKNSLGVLINHLDEVVETFKESEYSSGKLLSQLQYEAKRVNNNLIQLLSLYRLENSLYSLNISHTPLYDLIDEVVSQNMSLMEYKGIGIEIDCPDDLYWFIDKELIAGVLSSTMNNSFRYTKDMLRLSVYEKDSYLNICVEDNGVGYPPTMLGGGSGSNTRQISFTTGSTGLGIYFSEMVARFHKNKDKEGYISIANGGVLGGGIFCICLP